MKCTLRKRRRFSESKKTVPLPRNPSGFMLLLLWLLEILIVSACSTAQIPIAVLLCVNSRDSHATANVSPLALGRPQSHYKWRAYAHEKKSYTFVPLLTTLEAQQPHDSSSAAERPIHLLHLGKPNTRQKGSSWTTKNDGFGGIPNKQIFKFPRGQWCLLKPENQTYPRNPISHRGAVAVHNFAVSTQESVQKHSASELFRF